MNYKEKLWITNKIEEEKVAALASEAKIPTLIAKLFLSRGIDSSSYIHNFLQPDIKNLHDPFLLNDMKKAIDRIVIAINKKEVIMIFGDYDVDGVTSTSILYLFLKTLSENVYYYIPDRVEEGYGLTTFAIDNAFSKINPSLIITVDCGIVSFEEVKYITQQNIDIIITDHHECRESLPDAFAVINPHRHDNNYPFEDLAGVGVTFKLLQALSIELYLGDEYLKYIDLVALGTVADIVPLLGENRIIVKYGLIQMQKTKNIGLSTLIELSGQKDKELTSYTLGFVIAPRINAAGRIGDPERAVKLFTTENVSEAQNIAIQLNEENKIRQETESTILERALLNIESDPAYKEESIIVVYGNNWHHGVIGIVASRITERYYKPSIVISLDDSIAKGSARSICEFSIIDAITSVSHLLTRYGGHKAAAGLSLSCANLEEFRKEINLYANKKLTEYDLIPKIFIDTEILADDISKQAIQSIEMLAPFGQANPKPLFVSKGYKISNLKTLSEDRHLKLTASNKKFDFDTIGFNLGLLYPSISTNFKYDLTFFPEINTWNNVDRIQFNLKDIKKTFSSETEENYNKTLDELFENNSISACENFYDTCSDRIFQNIDEGKLIENLYTFKNLIIVNSLEVVHKITDLISCLKEKNKINYKLVFGTCDKDDYSTDNIIIVNPKYSALNIENFSNIIFAGSIFITSELKGFLEIIQEKNIYLLGLSQCKCIYENYHISRDDVVSVYKYFSLPGHAKISINDIQHCSNEIASAYDINMNSYKLSKILKILDEISVFKCKFSEKYNIILDIEKTNKKNELTDSSIFICYNNIKIFNNVDKA